MGRSARRDVYKRQGKDKHAALGTGLRGENNMIAGRQANPAHALGIFALNADVALFKAYGHAFGGNQQQIRPLWVGGLAENKPVSRLQAAGDHFGFARYKLLHSSELDKAGGGYGDKSAL